jgi:RHS repeat-associated protein
MKSFSPLTIILAALLVGHSAQAQSPNGNDNPTGVAGDYGGSITTGGGYDPYTGNGKRVIDDIVVPGAVGAYPLKWTRFLNTRSGWSNSYQYGLSIAPPYPYHCCDTYEGPYGHVYYPDGRQVDLWYVDSTHWDAPGSDGPQGIGDRVEATGGGTYKLFLHDGGQVLFATQSYWNGTAWIQDIYATAIRDPFGQTTTLGRDSQGRLNTVTEPGGRYLHIDYGAHGWSMVQAWDGRGNLIETVTYGYTTAMVYHAAVNNWLPDTRLTQVYYDDGAVATYTYRNSNVVNNSYNTVLGRLVETCDDPRFAGPMKRIKYEYMGGQNDAWGKLKAERNATTDQIVSQVTYPAYGDPNPGNRTETRGDGKTRLIVCGALGWTSWTDFQNHTTTVTFPAGGDGWVRTDARGNATTFGGYPGSPGAIKTVTFPRTDPNQPSATLEFTWSDPMNPYYLTGKKNENNNWTTFERDEYNRVAKINYPEGGTEEFQYNNLGQVFRHKLTSGGTEYFNYDNKANPWDAATRGLKTKHTDALGNVTTYEYYASGPQTDRLWRVTDPRGNSTTFVYNQRGQVTKTTHADQSYTQSGYNNDGTVAWTTDELGHTTSFAYDEYKRVLTVTNAMGETTTNYYGLDWANPLVHTTNNPKYTLSPLGKNVLYDYDENFRKVAQTLAAMTSDVATTWFEYDAVGNLTKTTDPRGNATTLAYDQRNRKIWMKDPIASDRNSNDHTMDWQYDAVGNKMKETRADNAFRSWEYDVPNRITRAVDWRMNESEPRVVTTYERDLPVTSGGITVTKERTKDAKNAVYEFQFDALHRKMSETYPPAYGNASPNEHYWYDAAGNLSLYKNPANQYEHLDFVDSYDSRNRLRHSAWNTSPTSGTADWRVGQEIRTNYDEASRMTQITTNGSETIVGFAYDSANRKISEDQTLAGYPARHIETPRDADGNRGRLSVTVYGNLYYALNFEYNQRNQLWNIYGNDNSRVAGYTYDAAGNVTNQCLYWIYANGTNYSYDALNRVATADFGDAGAVFQHNHYQYDKVGREVARWRDEPASKGERFWYNPTGHLTRAEYDADNVATGNTSNSSKFREYNYTADLLNWTSVNDNGYLAPFANNAMNQYTGINGSAPQYDGNFNQTTSNGATFVYNAQNQVVNGSMQATYDGLGRCRRRTVGGTTIVFTYDEWNPIVEWDAGGSWKAWTIYGAKPDEVLCRSDATYGALMYKRDNQGNVLFLLDGSNRRIEKYTYDVFGRATVTSWNYITNSWKAPSDRSSFGNRFMYTGREWITEIQHYDYRHRLYNPDTGRFLQSDPTGFDAGDMNLFRYCSDDPVDRSDPTGLENATASGWNHLMWLQGGSQVSSELFDQIRQDTARIVLELIPAGDRHISQKDVFLKDGKTRALGYTDPSFKVRDPVKQKDGSWKVTGVYTLDVKYADGAGTTAGPKSLNHAYNQEWRHAVPFDNWFGRALKTVERMNSVFHFKTPEEARNALQSQLQPGYDHAYQESLDIHKDPAHNSPYKYEE